MCELCCSLLVSKYCSIVSGVPRNELVQKAAIPKISGSCSINDLTSYRAGNYLYTCFAADNAPIFTTFECYVWAVGSKTIGGREGLLATIFKD